jgi:hypothetical protein
MNKNSDLSREQIEHELVQLLGMRLMAYFPSKAVDHPAVWVGQVFDNIRLAITASDAVAISIACELIGNDPMLPFGKLVKSGLARKLKQRAELLTLRQRQQIIDATLKLLGQEYAPRELEDYCKLIKKFPRSEYETGLSKISSKNSKSQELIGNFN